MNVIICLDDKNGMLFNNRRQSRDALVTEDILNNLDGKKLKILPFSKSLFDDSGDCVDVCESVDSLVSKDDVFFLENVSLKIFLDSIDTLTVYRWNRVYPCDFYCDLDFSLFSLCEEAEFKGNSHEKITKQIYRRVI